MKLRCLLRVRFTCSRYHSSTMPLCITSPPIHLGEASDTYLYKRFLQLIPIHIKNKTGCLQRYFQWENCFHWRKVLYPMEEAFIWSTDSVEKILSASLDLTWKWKPGCPLNSQETVDRTINAQNQKFLSMRSSHSSFDKKTQHTLQLYNWTTSNWVLLWGKLPWFVQDLGSGSEAARWP